MKYRTFQEYCEAMDMQALGQTAAHPADMLKADNSAWNRRAAFGQTLSTASREPLPHVHPAEGDNVYVRYLGKQYASGTLFYNHDTWSIRDLNNRIVRDPRSPGKELDIEDDMLQWNHKYKAWESDI